MRPHRPENCPTLGAIPKVRQFMHSLGVFQMIVVVFFATTVAVFEYGIMDGRLPKRLERGNHATWRFLK